eukprot:TRINITY_DN12312_c0_g1_i2.p1 TRINITY_DN12312_c0_g1~~TRINITY_DN12312_c0_g1_i2.p1  ORF type:complete len:1436 (+),score=672.00 TRINITY_DN12312_c0_g1_i2:167-4474(+)
MPIPNILPATRAPTRYVREPVCPVWLDKTEFDLTKHDPERLFDLCQRKVRDSQRTLDTTRKLTESLHNDPQYQYANAVQAFEELRKEHLQLNDSYNDLETINETIQEVVEVLRTDKHQLLAELNTLKRDISIQSIENTKLALKEKESAAFHEGLQKKLESQEKQMAQLDDELKDYTNSQIQINNEMGVLESAAENLSLQTASLAELRDHLDVTRVQQQEAIQSLENEIEQKKNELESHDEQLWDFKRDMSARILALQRKVNSGNEELARLQRLSEHEMDTLSHQNRTLNEELKSKSDQLFATRKEMSEFANSARREMNIKKEEVQQCLSIIDLVEKQNAGLEASIARMLEQNRVSENQIQEKDNINNKNLIEQANFIAMVHMELQTVREDLYMIKSRLCHHCRDRLLAEEELHDEQERLAELEKGPAAYTQNALQDPNLPQIAGAPQGELTHAGAGPLTQPPLGGAPEDEEAESEKRRVQEELNKAHEALEALNRQLLEEREQRDKERREEEAMRLQEETDRLARAQEEEEARRRQNEDDRRKEDGEPAKNFTIRFVNGTKKRVEAFLSDTVQDLINRVCSKIGVRPSEMFYISHAVNENSVLGMVDRFLDKSKTLREEGLNTKCILIFKFKHYKKLVNWLDTNIQDRYFQQLHHNVVSEYYLNPEKLAVGLAGYELQAVFGDATGRKRYGYFDEVGLDAYLPTSVTPLGYEYWQERLFKTHKKRKNLPPMKAREKYIDLLRERCPHWGMTFFDIRDKENRPFIAGVAEDGLHILTADKRVIIQSLKFVGGHHQLAGWEKSATGIFVKKRDSKLMTLYASSKLQTEEMYNLLNEYYLMLPRDVQEGLDIDISDRDKIAARLLPPETFHPPAVERTAPVEFESRAEYLKALYLEHVFSADDNDESQGPIIKFLNQLDECLDTDTAVEVMDISGAGMNDSDWALIADLIIRSLEYDPATEPAITPYDRMRNWKDNLLITKLDIADNNLTPASVAPTRDLLSHCVNLADINLSGIPLDNRHESELVEPMLKLNLQSLAMNRCSIGDNGARALLELLGNGNLHTVHLNYNRITANVVAELVECLDRPYCALNNLGLASNRIQLRGLEIIIKVMDRARRPETLNFADNPLQVRGGQRFGQLLEQQCGLTDLDISNTTGAMNITGDVALYITRQMLNNPEIDRVNFSDNPIGQNLHQLTDPEGQVTRDLPLEFFTFLEREAICNITVLELNRCQLTADHGAALVTALLDNFKLRKLEVSGNRLSLSDGGVSQGWIDLLETTSTLEHLDISRNGYLKQGVTVLMSAIARNRSLTSIIMDGNRATDLQERPNGGPTVSYGEYVYAFSTNRHLRDVRMADMGITDEVWDSICEGLAENRFMRKFSAPDNLITTRGVLDSTKHLSLNTTLEDLELTCKSVQENEDEYMRAYKFFIDNTNIETILL